MLENIEVLCHATIKINKGKVIYFDPYKVDKEYNDADIIMITHSHYDHFSEEDIQKVRKENTKIIITEDLYDRIKELEFKDEDILKVIPNRNYNIEDIIINTISSYNLNKQFHPKENNWVGYLIKMEGVSYYIAGDTDITEENKSIKCDVAFVPVGGTYTMTAQEAAELVNTIRPKVTVPIHYGSLVGTNQDAEVFSKNLNRNIKCEILMK